MARRRCLALLSPKAVNISNSKNLIWADGCYREIRKSRYLDHALTDCRDIWQDYAKMGIKCLNLSSFGQFRQYRTKSLLQSFHYIKILSGTVVAQSISFRVVSIYWQGDDPFPLKSWLQVTYLLLNAATHFAL